MIILHHVLHFLFVAISLAATLLPVFVRNNMKLKQLEADVEDLKAFLEHYESTVGK